MAIVPHTGELIAQGVLGRGFRFRLGKVVNRGEGIGKREKVKS